MSLDQLSPISLTRVPDLTRKTPAEAASALRAAGLLLGVVRQIGAEGPAVVLEQSTLAQTVAPVGTKVNLLIGRR